MGKLQQFITDLFTPSVTVREESESDKRYITPVNQAILTYVAAEVISGPNTTFLDKATFVAAPHVLSAVADLGAHKGYEESKK